LSSTNPATCTACPFPCLTCKLIAPSTVGCLSCPTNGYYYIPATYTCATCMPVCKTCLTGTTCLTCISSTLTLDLPTTTCVCTTGFLDPITLKCLACSTLIPNCQTCSYNLVYNPIAPTSIICLTANPGFYLYDPITLIQCTSYCTACNLDTTCLSGAYCYSTFTFLVGGTCACVAPLYLQTTPTPVCLTCS